MKLQRIRIAQFRQFRQGLEIRTLAPGINLFVGPNESGKSTMVRAIRAAFFERHRSSSVEDLLPRGDSSAAPSVELAFDWQGQRWTLNKSFLKTRRCDLTIDGEVLSGDAAEARLAELLHFTFPGKGASKAEHWGIPGLLWIEQGSGQDIQTPITHAGDYLKSALGQNLGEVTSSAGDDVLACVEQERRSLRTATGRSTGALLEIEKAHEALQTSLQELNAKITAYQQHVDRLGELRQQQRADASRPWEDLRRQMRQSQARLAEVADLERAQEREQMALQDCQARRQLGLEQLASFERERQDLARRDADRRAREGEWQALLARRADIQAQLAQAQSAWQSAEAQLRQARLHERHRIVAQQLKSLDQELRDLDGKLAQARSLQAQLLAQRGTLQANRVDAAALKQLRKLGEELGKLDVALKSVATRLQFALLPGQQLQLGDEVLSGEAERLLLEPVDLDIPGIGRLRILPGGEDIAERVRRHQSAQDRLTARLEQLQVDSLEQAETRADQHRTLQEYIRRDEALLQNLAPAGVDELASQQALRQQGQRELQAELATLPPPATDDLGVGAAERRQASAAERLKAAEQAASAHETACSVAEQASTSAQREWQHLNATIQSAEHQARKRALDLQLAELSASETALKDALAARRRQIDAARPDILCQDIERYTLSADALEKQAQERDRELGELHGRLDALGASGLEERRAELLSDLDAAGRRRDELRRRAAALDLLLGCLRSKRSALTRRIQAPLQRHLNHYLQLLFPQASLIVDENLMPQRLVRPGSLGPVWPGGVDVREAAALADPAGGQDAASSADPTHGPDGAPMPDPTGFHEDFETLSFGAREQMGLISRLAYADLLKEAGQPTLIILDDALVHSDARRLAQMKRILFDAGQRHQILLFTCHPDNWRDLGVPAVEMQSLQVTGG